jgi:hypothetical protein
MQNNYNKELQNAFKKQDNVFRFWHILLILLRITAIIFTTIFLNYIECGITKSNISLFAYIFPILYFIVYFIDNNLKSDFYHRHYYWKEKNNENAK